MAAIECIIGGKLYSDLEVGFGLLATDVELAFERGLMRAPPALLASLRNVSREMIRLHGNNWSGGSKSANLQRRSGEGLRSLIDSVKVQAGNGLLVARGEISGAGLSFHEQGGTIRATRSQYLTIPLPAALDPRGVPLRKRARDWDNTFVRRSKKGNLIIFRKIPGANDLTPLYVLKPSVTIRPRLKLEPTFTREMTYFEGKLLDELSDAIDQYL